ncbi:receptor-like protein EIX2 [Quercus suber]|uniref:Receptor-like protein eix2 n=1 Tax=Quercus suber TaxID=58331 RepID=A0AAW0JKG3_QUESU
MLKTLDIKANSFWGSIPDSIGNMSSLQELSLYGNMFNGTISKNVGKLSMLTDLDLIGNWKGVLTEAHFQNLTRLSYLRLIVDSATWSLVLDVKHDWVPPFNLLIAQIESMLIGPNFPAWVQTQTELFSLTLRNVGISDTIPQGFWNSFSRIKDTIPQVPHFQSYHLLFNLDLSFNNFDGQVPLFPSKKMEFVLLRENMFSGTMPENVGEILPLLYFLDLSSNFINGTIPPSIGMLKNLEILALRNNCLARELPHWEELHNLVFLDVANNNISGKLPSSMQFLSSLRWLSLGKNHLEGQFPSFLKNCTKLLNLDLAGNKFYGKLPAWIGESLSSLLRSSLRSNFFDSDIPQQFCLFSSLQILDLAQNDLSGGIPQCLGNLSKSDEMILASFSEEISRNVRDVKLMEEIDWGRVTSLHPLRSNSNKEGNILTACSQSGLTSPIFTKLISRYFRERRPTSHCRLLTSNLLTREYYEKGNELELRTRYCNFDRFPRWGGITLVNSE